MSISKSGKIIVVAAAATAAFLFAPFAVADDEEDILAFIQQYGELEDNLSEQSDMIRDDRTMITNVRQSDQKKNLEVQMALRKQGEAVNGGKTKFITTIEAPQVKIYDDVAVASFMRTFLVLPHNQPAGGGNPQWVTLVLVKEGGEWGIAHTHNSPAGAN